MSTPLFPAPAQGLTSSPSSSPAHRLLYRGALSLQDSHLLLDGLTFSAPTHSAGLNLLQNPLALALESMRGRQSLAFVGLERMEDVWLDTSGDVCMDIHPDAVISRIYFENVFCLMPGTSVLHEGKSEFGVRVALGDSARSSHSTVTSPEMTEMLIYAWHADYSPSQLELHVARITKEPPQPPPRLRVPRPDDPTPRRPPLMFEIPPPKRGEPLSSVNTGGGAGKNRNKKAKILADGGHDSKVTKSGGKGKMGGREGLAKLGSGVRLTGDAVFKTPSLPAKRKLVGIEAEVGEGVDVFGSADVHADPKGKGKGKQVPAVVEDEIEKTNKLFLKKYAVTQLAAQGISKSHPDFKELYGFVYRGAGFAMRTAAKTRWQECDHERRVVEAVVSAHVAMYVLGGGEWIKRLGSDDVTRLLAGAGTSEASEQPGE